MAPNTICWTDIPVYNLDRAIAFYSAVLAGPVDTQTIADFKFAVLPHGGSNVSACLSPADEDNQPSHIGPLVYFSVNGRLDEAVAAVEANGGKLLRPRHPIGPYGYRAIVIDSEGNRIALHSETA